MCLAAAGGLSQAYPPLCSHRAQVCLVEGVTARGNKRLMLCQVEQLAEQGPAAAVIDMQAAEAVWGGGAATGGS